MPGDSLHEVVAQSIWAAVLAPRADAVLATEQAAATTIDMVLAEAQQSIEAHRAGYEAAMRASTGGDDSTEAGAALDVLAEVLTILAALSQI